MTHKSKELAQRIVGGIDAQPGEIIQVRGDPGNYELLLELLLAIEVTGATPLVELFTAEYLKRLWADAPQSYLSTWDRHRARWLEQVDRVITCVRSPADLSAVPEVQKAAWDQATERLSAIQDRRLLPTQVVAVPLEGWASALDMPYERLEQLLLPALLAAPEQLQQEAGRVLAAIGDHRALAIRTGDGCELRLQQGDRPWLIDDGLIDPQDRLRGAIVSNLPAGSIYTTVLEDQTEGTLWLPRASEATEVTFTFEKGRVKEIAAARGGEELRRWLFSHTGEPGRISHVGIGLNPYLRQPIGWDIPVDEHVYGSLFLALGDNLYMGGQNASSLNIDFVIHQASFLAGGKAIVDEGKVQL